jgi:uncharacterized protein (DUF433 family)
MAAIVIVRNPEIMGGIPCFRGTRVPFQNLIDYLEAGDTLDQFLEQFPTVTRQMAIEALESAKDSLLTRIERKRISGTVSCVPAVPAR